MFHRPSVPAGRPPGVGVVRVAVRRRPRHRRVAQVLDHPVEALHALRAVASGLIPRIRSVADHVLHRPADLLSERARERARSGTACAAPGRSPCPGPGRSRRACPPGLRRRRRPRTAARASSRCAAPSTGGARGSRGSPGRRRSRSRRAFARRPPHDLHRARVVGPRVVLELAGVPVDAEARHHERRVRACPPRRSRRPRRPCAAPGARGRSSRSALSFVDSALLRYSIIAGCVAEATSMSWNRPSACLRITRGRSRGGTPTPSRSGS